MRGSAISSVTLAMTALLDASLAFLSFFLLRIRLFSNQTRNNPEQLKPENLPAASQLALPAVFPQRHPCDETRSDVRGAWLATRTKRCTHYMYSNPSLVVAWLHPF